jgi:hypothetical protein
MPRIKHALRKPELSKYLWLGLVIPILIVGLAISSGDASATQTGGQEVIEIVPDEVAPTVAYEYGEINSVTGVPVALYQVNFPVDSGTPEEMARQYLAENASSLRLLDPDLADLSHRITRESRSGSVVRFIQNVAGVPVYNSEIVVHVNNQYVVTFVLSNYKGAVEVDSVIPTLTPVDAKRIAYDYLGLREEIDPGTAALYVFHNQDMTRLAYQVRVFAADPLGDWEVLVDAHSGELIKVVNLTYDLDGHGPKQEEASLVDGTGYVFDPDPLTSATALYGDPGFVDGNDATTPQLDGERFLVTLPDIDFSGGMYTLIGPYAEIQDVEAPFYGLFSQASDAFLFNRFDNAFEAANTYYHIDFSMRYINETLGIPLMPYQYNGGVRFDPHGLNGADKSHYSGGRVAFGEGGVDDAEDSDVIHHELGHGLHDWVTNGGLSQVNGLSEGTGDYWAQSYNRSIDSWTPSDPQYNWVFRWDGHNPFWPGRVTNYFGHYPEDLTGQIHTDGQIWSTAMMKVWDAVGQTKADSALLEGLSFTSSSTNQSQAANAVYQAAIDLGYPISELVAMNTIFADTGYTMPPLPFPDFALEVDPTDLAVCVPGDATYSVQVQSQFGFTDDVTLSVIGEPAGTTTDFTPNGSAAPYTSTLTIGNTGSATLGTYQLEITGVATTATHTTTVGLELIDLPAAIVLVAPADGSDDLPTTVTFQWTADSMADTYTLDIATDPGFIDLVLTVSGITGTSYSNSSPLEHDTTYYWRVSGENLCGRGGPSATFSFTTVEQIFLPALAKP